MRRLTLLTFALLLLAVSSSPAEAQESRQIAYLANLTGEETCGAPGCEWRLFDPATGADRVLLTLPQIPRDVFWDARFQSVYYRVDRNLFRAAWEWDARPEVLLELPAELGTADSVVEFWRDAETNRWRIKALQYVKDTPIAGVWEFVPEELKWVVLEKQPTECECGGCPCADIVNNLVHRSEDVLLSELLERMRIEFHLPEKEPREGWAERTYEFPSATIAEATISVNGEWGDTFHAMAPLTYRNSVLGTEKVIYAAQEPCYDQIAFEEQGRFLLVVAEYTGGCARVTDLRTGALVRALPAGSIRAVWVTPPAH